MYRLIAYDYSLADIDRFTQLSIRRGIPLASLVRAEPSDRRVTAGAALLGAPAGVRPESEFLSAFARFLAGPGSWLKATPEEIAGAALEEGLLERAEGGMVSRLEPLPGVTAARLADELEAAAEILKLRRARMREQLQAKNREVNRAPEPESDPETDAHFMRLALGEARRAAAAGEIPVGAVVVDAAGGVVAAGGNETLRRSDPTAHAEVVTLRAAARAAANHRLTDTTLYVTLEPCPMCAGAIAEARCRRIVYGAGDTRRGALEGCFRLFDIPGVNHRPSITGGVLADECAALLRDFFARRREERKAGDDAPEGEA